MIEASSIMLDSSLVGLNVWPVLGRVGVQELLALVFVLVSVISYIIRTVQGNNQRMPPPVQRPGRRRDERVNDEIENFLQNVSRSSEAKREPAREESRPKPPGNRQQVPTSQRPSGKSSSGSNQPGNRRPGDIASRPVSAASELGGGLKQHLREQMAERVVKNAQRDVGQSVSESVQKHLGTMGRTPGGGSALPLPAADAFVQSSTPQTETCCKTNRAETLKKMLRSPDSMRQAIIIQEVLNRPKCLR